MRLLRAIGPVVLGFWAGLMAAAAIMKRVLPSRGDAESDELALVAIFDGIDLESSASAFRGGSMFAWFGGISADLRAAKLSSDGAHLDLHALNGGIAIKVPEGWRVRSSVRAFAGGVDVRAVEPEAADGPTLTLEGFAAFGGVAVTAKPQSTSDPPGSEGSELAFRHGRQTRKNPPVDAGLGLLGRRWKGGS